jgi:hypothetical protein
VPLTILQPAPSSLKLCANAFERKYISRNVGKIIDTKHGPKLLLERHFNPGGLDAGEDGMVWLSRPSL